MLNHVVRYGCVLAVAAFAAVALGVRPTSAGERPAPSAFQGGAGLVSDREPASAEEAAALAVRQLGELGRSASVLRSERFIIVSDAPQQWTLARQALLERALHQLRRFAARMGLELREPDRALLCVLVNDHADYTEFARRFDGVEAGWIAGYYASLSNRIVFYNDATSPVMERAGEQLSRYEQMAREARTQAARARSEKRSDVAATLEGRAGELLAHSASERRRLEQSSKANAGAKAVHEAVHLLAFNLGLQLRDRQYPFWLTEGLACAFETDKPNQAFGPDREYEPRQRDFEKLREQGRLMPMDVLVQLTSVPDNDEATAEVMYTQSWSLVRFLVRYERDSFAEFVRDFQRRGPGRIGAKEQLSMFTARFGDPAILEKRWLRQ